MSISVDLKTEQSENPTDNFQFERVSLKSQSSDPKHEEICKINGSNLYLDKSLTLTNGHHKNNLILAASNLPSRASTPLNGNVEQSCLVRA